VLQEKLKIYLSEVSLPQVSWGKGQGAWGKRLEQIRDKRKKGADGREGKYVQNYPLAPNLLLLAPKLKKNCLSERRNFYTFAWDNNLNNRKKK